MHETFSSVYTSHKTLLFSSKPVHLPALFNCIPPQYRCLHAYTTTFQTSSAYLQSSVTILQSLTSLTVCCS